MSGFGQTIETPAAVGAEAPAQEVPINVNAELRQFVATLPDVDTVRESLFTLEFYALCPNGKRIPVKSICEEYTKEPAGLAYRSFDNRVILVIQAIFPGKEVPYWQQVFYLSTGQSSAMRNTWLPMNGIMLNDQRVIFFSNPNKGTYELELWYAKDEFTARSEARFLSFERNLKTRKLTAIKDLYDDGIFLPEGYLLYRRSPFDRFGTLSYLLASHAIGGELFQTGNVDYFAEAIYNEELKASLMKHITIPSPLQPCFPDIAKTYPITRLPAVNSYIDEHKATSIMNAFREYNLFPPSLAEVSVLVPSLGYTIPVRSAWINLKREVWKLFQEWKMGNLTLEDIRATLSDRAAFLEKIRTGLLYFGDEPTLLFNIPENHKSFYKNYLGGKRKSRKRQGKKKRTRKSKK